MEKDTAALLLSGVAMLIGLLGLWQLLTTSARSAALAERSDYEGDAPLGRRLLAGVDRRLAGTGVGERLARWLRSAGVPFSALDYLIGLVVGSLLIWVIGRTFMGGTAALLVGVAVVIGGTRFYVERRRAQRRDAFIGQLPELSRVLANGTQAGLAMAGAVQLAARELDDPAGEEMRGVLEELRVGRALDESLESLRDRLPSREVGVLMTTIIIQQRAGGDTVRALQELGATLEARKDLLREIKTLLSGSVYTSYVVAAIGIGAILMTNIISPGVMREMTSTALGLISLAIAGILWGIAFVLIRQTTKIEV